jgi:peroxiredoxin family protein
MPPEEAGPSPDKLSLVVFSGSFEKVHYALATAAAALAVNRSATLFFTMEAVRALRRVDAEGRPGWASLPAAEGASGAERDAAFEASGVATFEELIEACAALGATFMVCEMGLRAMDVSAAELRDDIAIAEGGIVTFLNDASASGAMLFI